MVRSVTSKKSAICFFTNLYSFSNKMPLIPTAFWISPTASWLLSTFCRMTDELAKFFSIVYTSLILPVSNCCIMPTSVFLNPFDLYPSSLTLPVSRFCKPFGRAFLFGKDNLDSIEIFICHLFEHYIPITKVQFSLETKKKATELCTQLCVLRLF